MQADFVRNLCRHEEGVERPMRQIVASGDMLSAFLDKFGGHGVDRSAPMRKRIAFKPGLNLFNYLSTGWQFDFFEALRGAVSGLLCDFVFQIGESLLQLL